MREELRKLQGLRVLVVGDLMLDRYQWGEAARLSPEAPVPVVRVEREETRLGGAANVANNLLALGCRVGLLGLVGDDASGVEMRAMLSDMGVDCTALVVDRTRPTTVKNRVMARGQQLLRSDTESAEDVAGAALEAVETALAAAVAAHDGVILSDYGKGLVSPHVAGLLVAECAKAGKMLVVDPKGTDYARYRGATCLTPNALEATAVTGIAVHGEPAALEASALEAARALRAMVEARHVCVTLGAGGVLGLDGDTHRHLPTRAREVYDVTGAGDTFISVLGALLIAGQGFFVCMELANLAAGLVVGKLGTATVTAEEIVNGAEGPSKLLDGAQAATVADALRARGRRIVFTNGCFDLLHAGHIQYLQASRNEGDLLIVGLNSDASVRRLKGPSRPVIHEEDRARVLAALACVDHVVIFDEDTPEALIRAVRPHVLTKGADYAVNEVVGHDMVTEWGGRVALIPLAENRSTSGMIERIQTGRGIGEE